MTTLDPPSPLSARLALPGPLPLPRPHHPIRDVVAVVVLVLVLDHDLLMVLLLICLLTICATCLVLAVHRAGLASALTGHGRPIIGQSPASFQDAERGGPHHHNAGVSSGGGCHQATNNRSAEANRPMADGKPPAIQ